ncbi:MAG: hypothetical protein M3Q30_10760 [Actinomycetota bacterium]|nr:hypothetical protein [Actinomycetota bacterium]
MPSTQSAHSWFRSRPPRPAPNEHKSYESKIEAPARERVARREIVRLRDEIEQLVRVEGNDARGAVDAALESVTRLQIVTANVDACAPLSASLVGATLVAMADARLHGHADAIERGMTYTADNQLRLLQGDV